MAKRSFQIQKSRAPWIATTLVLAGGSITCLIIAVPFSDNLTIPLLIIAGIILCTSGLLSLLRRQTQDFMAELYALTATEKKQKVQLKLRRLRDVEQSKPQRPPNADDIREIKGK